MLLTKKIWVFVLFLFVATGCSLLEASPEEVEKYRKDFIAMVDKAAIEAENGQKVLSEIRHKVDQEGLKKTKAQNTLSDATSIANKIKDDMIRAQVPTDMEPIREKIIVALDKRIEAYDQLFLYYDFLKDEFRVKGDALLEESLQLFDEALADMEPFRK